MIRGGRGYFLRRDAKKRPRADSVIDLPRASPGHPIPSLQLYATNTQKLLRSPFTHSATATRFPHLLPSWGNCKSVMRCQGQTSLLRF